MRPTCRLAAAVRKTLEPGSPTGLTGLHTLNSPRSTLMHLYASTLSKLSQMPASSIYRQSTEALTKRRLAIIEAHEPPGFDAWRRLQSAQISVFNQISANLGDNDSSPNLVYDGNEYVMARMEANGVDDRDVQWEGKVGDKRLDVATEGPMDSEDRAKEISKLAEQNRNEVKKQFVVECEPPFTMDQVAEIENAIGAGLLEEIVQVANGENLLAGLMLKNKVWEELCEKAPDGQWEYFERQRHSVTQKA